MIGFMPQNGECPVELFDKDEPYQFVREGHLAERYFLVGTVIHFLGKAVRAAHDKHQPLAAARHATLQPLAVIYGRSLGAVLVEQHNVVAGLEGRQQLFPFSNLLLGFTHVAGALHITDVLDVEGDIVL